MHPVTPSRTTVAAFLAILAYFLYFAAGGLQAYFTSDDAINLVHLHGYFTTPIYKIALDVLNPFTSAYRPLGGLFYRIVYAFAGYNPAPFRYLCFLLLLVNMGLAFRLLRLLSDSTEAAILGLLLISYHPAMSELYYSTGTIYDILCYLFFAIALTSYIERRRRGLRFSPGFLILLLLFNLLALQAKEIGCMLPAAIFLFEACYRGFSRRSINQLAPLILTAAFTCALLLHRLLTPNEMSQNPLYQPRLSPTFYLETCARYHSLLFFSDDLLSVPAMLCLWGAMGLAAALLRSKPMAFGLSFWILALVPVAVIPGRGAFVLYIPIIGLGLYFGSLAIRLRDAVIRPRFRFVSQIALFGLLIASLAVAYGNTRSSAIAGILQTDRDSRGVMTQLHRLHPSVKPGAHILFADDPFPPASWYLTFAPQLMYHDPGISIDRVKTRPHARAYDYVFTYAGDRLTELALPPCPMDSKPTAEAMDDSSLRICWEGTWTPGDFPLAYDGTLTFTNQKGAAAIFNFEGSSLTYVYTKAYNRGIAEVLIDGVTRGTVDQYAPNILWRQKTAFDGLSPGKHTAEVRVPHRRNPAAKDSYVDVDAFIPGPSGTSP